MAISREHHVLLSLAVGLNESALKGHRRHARAGTPLGEFWVLDELARDCAYDGQHAFLLVSVPVSLWGGSAPRPRRWRSSRAPYSAQPRPSRPRAAHLSRRSSRL